MRLTAACLHTGPGSEGKGRPMRLCRGEDKSYRQKKDQIKTRERTESMSANGDGIKRQ